MLLEYIVHGRFPDPVDEEGVMRGRSAAVSGGPRDRRLSFLPSGASMEASEMVEEFLPAGIRGGSIKKVVDDRIRVHPKFRLHLGKLVLWCHDASPGEGGFDSSNPDFDVGFVE